MCRYAYTCIYVPMYNAGSIVFTYRYLFTSIYIPVLTYQYLYLYTTFFEVSMKFRFIFYQHICILITELKKIHI